MRTPTESRLSHTLSLSLSLSLSFVAFVVINKGEENVDPGRATFYQLFFVLIFF
jgi:hypothetical protein